jgi:hypothetical protein
MGYFKMLTREGGEVVVARGYSGLMGDLVRLHVDQTANIRNDVGEANINLSVSEAKEMIAGLHFVIMQIEGKPHIKLYDEPVIEEKQNEPTK